MYLDCSVPCGPDKSHKIIIIWRGGADFLMCIKAKKWIILDDVSWFPRGEQTPKDIFYSYLFYFYFYSNIYVKLVMLSARGRIKQKTSIFRDSKMPRKRRLWQKMINWPLKGSSFCFKASFKAKTIFTAIEKSINGSDKSIKLAFAVF